MIPHQDITLLARAGRGNRRWSVPLYVKLFSSILDSSLWDQDHHVVRVWIAVLAMCDDDGIVRASWSGIAHRARVTPEEGAEALKILSADDPDSKDPGFEGRRIERCPDGYLVLNYLRYRRTINRDDEREKGRDRSKRYRDKRRSVNRDKSRSVTHSHAPSRPSRDESRHLEEEEEEDTEAEKKKNPPNPPKGGQFPRFPPELDTKEFRKAWGQWWVHRMEIRKKLTPSTVEGQIKALVKVGQVEAIARIERSIENGWTGLFPTDGQLSLAKRPNRSSAWDEDIAKLREGKP